MSFKKGDRVRHVDDAMGGVVTLWWRSKGFGYVKFDDGAVLPCDPSVLRKEAKRRG